MLEQSSAELLKMHRNTSFLLAYMSQLRSCLASEAMHFRSPHGDSNSQKEIMVQVACQTLGYTVGAEIIYGYYSPLPARGVSSRVSRFECEGTEPDISECSVNLGGGGGEAGRLQPAAVSLLCTRPSGALFLPAIGSAVSCVIST